MNHPYPKHDYILERDLTNAERLEGARSTLRHAIFLLDQFSIDTLRASDLLSENQLEIICKACDMAHKAAENCAFLGNYEFNAHPLEMVKWEDA